MGAYDSSHFSKMFSERTMANYEYISNVVNRDILEQKAQEQFKDKYKQLIEEVDGIRDELRNEANQIVNVQKKGKNELKKKLHSIASKLDRYGSDLSSEMEKLVSTKNIEGDKLYEVTQLLNSLMGIAVLPYEMHKEFFKEVEVENHSEDNRNLGLHQIQDSVKDSPEYFYLQKYIVDLYDAKKWKSTYSGDVQNRIINTDIIVFRFLRHIRNATCHSGDNAISILPLTEGSVIKHIMFYDNYKNQEFAMCISVEELKELVSKIAAFYCNSKIGYINKTKSIEEAEKHVREILNIQFEEF